GGAQHFETAEIVFGKGGFAADERERRAAFAAGFGERECARGEIEGSEADLARWLGPERLPVQPAGNHQVQDEKQVVLQCEDDAFAEAAQSDDALAVGFFNRRLDAAKEKWVEQTDAL